MNNEQIKQITFVRATYGNYNEIIFYIENEVDDTILYVYLEDMNDLIHKYLDKGYEIKIINKLN
jgi:ACT domain-containing protein